MIKKNAAIFVIVVSCLLGIYWFSTPSEHDRWLAALGLSKQAAMRVAEERAQRKRDAQLAQETARARANLMAAQGSTEEAQHVSRACESLREQARRLTDAGEAMDDALAAKLTNHCDLR